MLVDRHIMSLDGNEVRGKLSPTSLICDKSVTTQNLAVLSYRYRKERLQVYL